MLCLAFGPDGVTYAGTLSGDIYKWNKNKLAGTVPGSHEVYGTLTLSQFIKHDWNCMYLKLMKFLTLEMHSVFLIIYTIHLIA